MPDSSSVAMSRLSASMAEGINMTTRVSIYEIDSSVGEDRPWIDFELPDNARQDWMMINNAIDNQSPIEGPLPIEVTVNSVDALKWDYLILHDSRHPWCHFRTSA
jgi:hypothetical protein